MASKKSTALAKSTGEAGGLVVASWMKEMAEKARNVASVFRTGVPRIIHRQAQLMVDGQSVTGNKLPVIIIEAAFEKSFYKKSFDPEEKSTPDCYSFHAADKPMAEAHVEMVPNPACAAKQSDTCSSCPHNRFGTAAPRETGGKPGKGKRCADHVRLLCISPNNNKGSLLKAQVRLFSVPANSLGNWGAYVGQLADMGMLPQMVITEISCAAVPPPGQGYKITFNPVSSISEEQYREIASMQERAIQTLTMPYPTLGAAEEADPEVEKRNAKRRAKVR